MKYKLFLKCRRCNKTGEPKEYDCSRAEIKEKIRKCNQLLHNPKYIICPQCRHVLSVQPMLVTIK